MKSFLSLIFIFCACHLFFGSRIALADGRIVNDSSFAKEIGTELLTKIGYHPLDVNVIWTSETIVSNAIAAGAEFFAGANVQGRFYFIRFGQRVPGFKDPLNISCREEVDVPLPNGQKVSMPFVYIWDCSPSWPSWEHGNSGQGYWVNGHVVIPKEK